MRPTLAQRFFASPWPPCLWFILVPILFAAALLADTRTTDFTSWRALLPTIGLAIGALIAGLLIAAVTGWWILGPLYYSRALKNGGPFVPGDTVYIISGPHKGTITGIYSTWQGDTIRADLGPQAKDKFKDIFSAADLLRVHPPAPTP
jgi:hypothetical protein